MDHEHGDPGHPGGGGDAGDLREHLFDPTRRSPRPTDEELSESGRRRAGDPICFWGTRVGWDLSPFPGRTVDRHGRPGQAPIRLWPMPDLSKPPLHTLPREEVLAKLKSLTNLRAMRDAESSTGWKIEAGPFPGWEDVPTW